MAYIEVTGTIQAQSLRGALAELLNGRDHLLRVRDAMVQARDVTPDPDDYTVLEAAFGMQAGNGVLAFAEVDSLNGALASIEASVRQCAAIFGVILG